MLLESDWILSPSFSCTTLVFRRFLLFITVALKNLDLQSSGISGRSRAQFTVNVWVSGVLCQLLGQCWAGGGPGWLYTIWQCWVLCVSNLKQPAAALWVWFYFLGCLPARFGILHSEGRPGTWEKTKEKVTTVWRDRHQPNPPRLPTFASFIRQRLLRAVNYRTIK